MWWCGGVDVSGFMLLYEYVIEGKKSYFLINRWFVWFYIILITLRYPIVGRAICEV